MKCKIFRENIVLDLYGELDKREKEEFEKHLSVCHECRRDYTYSKTVFTALEEAGSEEIPEPAWESSWKRIHRSMQGKPQNRPRFLLFPKWTYAVAGAALLFALGIFAGRHWIPLKQTDTLSAGLTEDSFQKSLERHFENIKPVLVEMANYTSQSNGNGTVLVDKQALEELIVQNIILKSFISGHNPTALQVLEDVELVLRELANIDEGDSGTKSMLKKLIDDRQILLNMKILQQM